MSARCALLQYELNLAGAAEDYTAGDKSLLSNPLVSPLLAEYGNGRPFPPTLIQACLLAAVSFASSTQALEWRLTSCRVHR
jgi:hypothetical protein